MESLNERRDRIVNFVTENRSVSFRQLKEEFGDDFADGSESAG